MRHSAVHLGQGGDGLDDPAVRGAPQVEEGGGLVVAAVVDEAADLVVLGQVEVDLEEGGIGCDTDGLRSLIRFAIRGEEFASQRFAEMHSPRIFLKFR